MSVVIFSNQKGGVGKTTLTRELGIYAAGSSRRILLVDCDPQGNLTKSLTDKESPGLYESFIEGKVFLNQISENLSLFTGNYRLAALEKSLIGEIDCYTRLRDLLKGDQFSEFEHIFLDTPPSLGVLTVNALTASEHIVIPMNPSLYSMQGTNDLLVTINKVRRNLNPNLTLLGVIINAYDSRPVITRQIKDEIRGEFGGKVFATVLSRTIKIEESIAEKEGVIFHRRLDKSRIKEEITAIGDELLERLGAAYAVRPS